MEKPMKKLAVLMLAVGALLSGCVAYEVPPHERGERYGERHGEHRDEQRGERDRDRDGVPDRVDRDRDGDGVRNRQDRRPDDARRY